MNTTAGEFHKWGHVTHLKEIPNILFHAEWCKQNIWKIFGGGVDSLKNHMINHGLPIVLLQLENTKTDA